MKFNKHILNRLLLYLCHDIEIMLCMYPLHEENDTETMIAEVI